MSRCSSPDFILLLESLIVFKLQAPAGAAFRHTPFAAIGFTHDPLLQDSTARLSMQLLCAQGVQPSKRGMLTASIGYPTHTCQSAKIYCMAIHLTCIYLAAKSVEMVPFKRLLQTMLSHVHERQVGLPRHAAACQCWGLLGVPVNTRS